MYSTWEMETERRSLIHLQVLPRNWIKSPEEWVISRNLERNTSAKEEKDGPFPTTNKSSTQVAMKIKLLQESKRIKRHGSESERIKPDDSRKDAMHM